VPDAATALDEFRDLMIATRRTAGNAVADMSNTQPRPTEYAETEALLIASSVALALVEPVAAGMLDDGAIAAVRDLLNRVDNYDQDAAAGF
jgi:hypothetical protein